MWVHYFSVCVCVCVCVCVSIYVLYLCGTRYILVWITVVNSSRMSLPMCMVMNATLSEPENKTVFPQSPLAAFHSIKGGCYNDCNILTIILVCLWLILWPHIYLSLRFVLEKNPLTPERLKRKLMGSSMVSYQNLCVVAAWGFWRRGRFFRIYITPQSNWQDRNLWFLSLFLILFLRFFSSFSSYSLQFLLCFILFCVTSVDRCNSNLKKMSATWYFM